MRLLEIIRSILQRLSKKGVFSLLSIVTCMILVINQSYEAKKWEKDEIVLADAITYYAYLPSIIIFHDISFNYLFNSQDPRTNGMRVWASTNEYGNHYLKMPAGESVLLAPFFLVSHWVALSKGEIANGYSETYYYGIAVAAWVYLFLGLLLIRGALRKLELKDLAITLALLMLGLATNLLHYASLEPGISHIYSFFLFALVLYLTISISKKPSLWKMIALGATLGLIMITRPTNVLIALVPVLYGVYSWNTLKERFQLAKFHWKHIFASGVAFGAVAFIQPLLWKLGTGEWIIYSYEKERLFFSDPQIFKLLFSYRKGLFIYSPILLLAFIGLFVGLRTFKKIQVPIILFTLLNIYVIASWWCWWYGGSLGARPMVESYAILALPMTVLLDRIVNKFTLIPLSVLLIYATKLNFFYEERYSITYLHYDSMSKAAYWEMVSNPNLTNDYWDLLERPSYSNRLLGNSEEEPLIQPLFLSKDIVYDTTEFPGPSLEMNAKSYFKYTVYSEIEVDAVISIDSALTEDKNLTFVISFHNYKTDVSYIYQTLELDKTKITPNSWNKFSLKCPVYPLGDDDATLRIYLWNRSGQKVKVKEFKIVQKMY